MLQHDSFDRCECVKNFLQTNCLSFMELGFCSTCISSSRFKPTTIYLLENRNPFMEEQSTFYDDSWVFSSHQVGAWSRSKPNMTWHFFGNFDLDQLGDFQSEGHISLTVAFLEGTFQIWRLESPSTCMIIPSFGGLPDIPSHTRGCRWGQRRWWPPGRASRAPPATLFEPAQIVASSFGRGTMQL